MTINPTQPSLLLQLVVAGVENGLVESEEDLRSLYRAIDALCGPSQARAPARRQALIPRRRPLGLQASRPARIVRPRR